MNHEGGKQLVNGLMSSRERGRGVAADRLCRLNSTSWDHILICATQCSGSFHPALAAVLDSRLWGVRVLC